MVSSPAPRDSPLAGGFRSHEPRQAARVDAACVEHELRGERVGFVERGLDVLLASVGLVLLGLCIPLVWAANRVWAPGPLLHRQVRVGRGNRPFVMFKLRTMVVDAEPDGPRWAAAEDARVTAVGRVLRRCHLDELPQCWNVLRGEMSVVGPRPERPELVAALSRALVGYERRHAIRPGLTGYAQIHYRYDAALDDVRQKLEHDLYYVRRRSIGLYLTIVIRTVAVVARARGR